MFKSRIRSHRNQVVEDCLTAISPDEVLRQGGAGNKVLRVIEGIFEKLKFSIKTLFFIKKVFLKAALKFFNNALFKYSLDLGSKNEL